MYTAPDEVSRGVYTAPDEVGKRSVIALEDVQKGALATRVYTKPLPTLGIR